MGFDFEKKSYRTVDLESFAEEMLRLSKKIGFKVSSRGWCYLLEQSRFINKDQFDKAEHLINRCRREGLLPVDFVAEESSRQFSGVESKTSGPVIDTLKWAIRDVLTGYKYYTPDWWDGEEFYVQMVVEKIDLKTLFEPVAEEYHIPIANAKGWSSILQRAEYAKRFKRAEERGLRTVLLYCGDHDPDGLRISDTIRTNLQQVSDVVWESGGRGYDPRNLEIVRFGLNYDFIEEHGYTWIDNLKTGSGGELAIDLGGGEYAPGKTAQGKPHKNFPYDYVQNYLGDYGVRKCEANAIVTTPAAAQGLCRQAIVDILGEDALDRFNEKREAIDSEYRRLLHETGLRGPIVDLVGDDDDEYDENDYDEDDDE